ncbi:MAG: DinB family protein [Ferruginibacter sp.]
MKKNYLFISLLLLLFSTSSLAQLAESLKAQLVKDWTRAKAYTQEYLDVMPADKYGFRAQDSIRTFSEQMLHLTAGTIGLVSNGTGKDRIFPGYNLEKSTTAQTKDSVVYYVNAAYDFAIDGIKNLDASKFEEKVKRGNFDETRLAWIMKGFEHQTHHRGQVTIYIRLLGIKPPNEKLF